MRENYLTPLEIYMNKAYKLLIVIIPSIALCAGATFTALHLMGFYPEVKTSTMVIFDCTCVIYTIIGIVFHRNCEDKDGFLIPQVLKMGKIFMAVLMFVQWNFISYMVPSRDFWAYSFFFVILAAFFLDSKYVLIIIAEVSASLVVCWVIRPDETLPVKDELFVPDMVLRIVLMVLFYGAIWMLTLTIERRLAKELEKISDYDTLTLLYNRRKLSKYIEYAAEQSEINGPFSLIMSDIDDFKKVNDTYGHSCGDEVLKDIANIMRSVCTNRGMVFRYGGEEMLALVYADEEEAFSIAEEIRKRIENHNTIYEEKKIKVTLTLGVATYTKQDTEESLVKRADANLYYGKSHGRNCVVK